MKSLKSLTASELSAIQNECNQLREKNQQLYDKFDLNAIQFQDFKTKYDKINQTILTEGMQNMDDLYGMLRDSKLIAEQSNSHLVAWSALMISAFIVFIRMSMK